MKFVLKQEKLNYMLEKLSVGNMFPSCVLSTKDGNVFSIQREESGRSLRMAKFNENFFDEIEKNGIESIEIDVNKFLATVKRLPPGMVLTFETVGNKVSIKGKFNDGRPMNPQISYRTPEQEVMTKLTFEVKEGIPLVGKEKIPLDTSIEINISDFKDIFEYASAMKTEFYKFSIENDMLIVRVGDLHDTSDSNTFGPKSKILKGEELETIFTYGISEISKTFDSTVFINTKTRSPAWFYEVSKEHMLGVFIPPYIDSEE